LLQEAEGCCLQCKCQARAGTENLSHFAAVAAVDVADAVAGVTGTAAFAAAAAVGIAAAVL
jgi:hypothetical protein